MEAEDGSRSLVHLVGNFVVASAHNLLVERAVDEVSNLGGQKLLRSVHAAGHLDAAAVRISIVSAALGRVQPLGHDGGVSSCGPGEFRNLACGHGLAVVRAGGVRRSLDERAELVHVLVAHDHEEAEVVLGGDNRVTNL